jgi:hypothetical protein
MNIQLAYVTTSYIAVHLSFKTIGGAGVVGGLLGQSCGGINHQVVGISDRL